MQRLTDEELARLRIFPLPGVTLFPHAFLPLHVFEPRYRKLVEDCLAGGLPIAPWGIDVRAPQTERGPGLHDVGTAGRIRSHRRHPDGRFDIVIEGIERLRRVAEDESREPYRVLRVERHPLGACEPAELRRRIATLESLAGTLALQHPRAARLLQVTLGRCKEPDELSDVLCAITHDDPRLRQHLLQLSSIEERLDRVVETLSTLMLRAEPEDGGTDGDVQ